LAGIETQRVTINLCDQRPVLRGALQHSGRQRAANTVAPLVDTPGVVDGVILGNGYPMVQRSVGSLASAQGFD
jgi:hypothetical protein